MIDRYTKVILTVIAVALSVLAWQNASISPATALGNGCGEHPGNACFVVTKHDHALNVNVVSMPLSMRR